MLILLKQSHNIQSENLFKNFILLSIHSIYQLFENVLGKHYFAFS